jgi:hypothetical protein
MAPVYRTAAVLDKRFCDNQFQCVMNYFLRQTSKLVDCGLSSF